MKILEVEEKSIDKNYQPTIGDVLYLEGQHPFVVVTRVYELPIYKKTNNADFQKELIRYSLIHKIIRKKEKLWQEDRFDLNLFPEDPIGAKRIKYSDRGGIAYATYCAIHDPTRYQRLYLSKYFQYPQMQKRQQVGTRKMITVTHSLCVTDLELNKTSSVYGGRVGWGGKYCIFYGSSRSLPLSHYITNRYKYRGNVYTDIYQFPKAEDEMNGI